MAADTDDNLLLFVYGTLRQDVNGKRHPLLKAADYLDQGRVDGTLYEIAGYPGLIADGTAKGATVEGELYRLHALRALDWLDDYEECSPKFPQPHEYRRIRASVTLNDGQRVDAWLYHYNRHPHGLKRIASGDYRLFSRQRS